LAQFSIYRLSSGRLVCDIQSDLIEAVGTRLVVPLVPLAELTPMPSITPVVVFAETRWVVVVPQIGAVSETALRAPIGTLAQHRDAIKRAIDNLIDGV